MLGIYFSGTGNTKHCVEHFVKLYDDKGQSVSIESPEVVKLIKTHDTFVLGYPIYYSNMPKIMQDFLARNKRYFRNKSVFILATMGLFSGDGAGCAARMLKKQKVNILGGLHLKMPDCIGDEKILKKSKQENLVTIAKAEEKIAAAVEHLKRGAPPQQGLGRLQQAAGFLGQRLWFYTKSTEYKNKPKIDLGKCIGCGRCAGVCPMNNLKIEAGKAVSTGRCTLCYRCFSHCPAKAITILGEKVYEQYLFESCQK